MQRDDRYTAVLMVRDHDKLMIKDGWLPCYVLENGEFVLSMKDFYECLQLNVEPAYLTQSLRFILRKTFDLRDIKYNLNKKFASFKITLMEYEVYGRKIFLGELTKFEELCEIIIELGNALKHLEPDQLALVERAEAFLRSAMDQGFSDNRFRPIGRIVTRTIFRKYLSDSLAKWTVTFPEEFYENLFRLKGLGYPPPPGSKKISGLQLWVNDIIYSRLSSEVLTTLHTKRPQMHLKQLTKEFNYFILDEYGHHLLYLHLSNVIFLMRCCTTWEDFMRRLDMAAPLGAQFCGAAWR